MTRLRNERAARAIVGSLHAPGGLHFRRSLRGGSLTWSRSVASLFCGSRTMPLIGPEDEVLRLQVPQTGSLEDGASYGSAGPSGLQGPLNQSRHDSDDQHRHLVRQGNQRASARSPQESARINFRSSPPHVAGTTATLGLLPPQAVGRHRPPLCLRTQTDRLLQPDPSRAGFGADPRAGASRQALTRQPSQAAPAPSRPARTSSTIQPVRWRRRRDPRESSHVGRCMNRPKVDRSTGEPTGVWTGLSVRGSEKGRT